MSGLAILLLAALASACGAWASLKCRPPLVAAAAAAILFAAAGVAAVLVSWITGDGIVLPGRQISPGLVAYYLTEEAVGRLPPVGRALILLAPLAHAMLALVRRDRAALLRPLPATAIFLWLLASVGGPGRATVVQAPGPDRVAYLTIAPRDGGARLILAAGEPLAPFLEVLHVHETEGTPLDLHVHWTGDGKAVVLRLHEEKDPMFAIDLDGNVTGALPAKPREWTPPGGFVPPDVQERFSLARKEVFKLIQAHGGLAPP
ncbi:MAG: hypothetical protein L6Q95_02795 [Planctomycetes bacterium]|nr:hypothetical protein [Planctomycetota bacterium]